MAAVRHTAHVGFLIDYQQSSLFKLPQQTIKNGG